MRGKALVQLLDDVDIIPRIFPIPTLPFPRKNADFTCRNNFFEKNVNFLLQFT